MINKEQKAKWVAALRSGAYTQGKSVLRDIDNTYCCLGVLAETLGFTATPANLDDALQRYYKYEIDNRWFVTYLPRDLLPGAFQSKLAQANDAGVSFTDIADIIDDYFLNFNEKILIIDETNTNIDS